MPMTGLHFGLMAVRWIVRSTAIMMLVAMVAAVSGSTPGPASAETEAFERVYFSALLSGRDADAAVRKARFRTGILVKDFGMSRAEAAAEVAKFMIWRTGRLCGG